MRASVDTPLRRRARSRRPGRRPAPPRPWLAAFCRVALRALSLSPLRVSHAIGAALGTLAAVLPTRPARTTRINLQLALGDLDDAARRSIARRSLAGTGRAALELGGVWLWRPDRVLSLVVDTVGEECFAEAAAAGRGAIVASMHLGSWETGLLYLGRRYGAGVMYRPPRIRELDTFVAAARERTGAKMLPVSPAGVRGAIRTLEQNGVVISLADQDPGLGAGVFVPFFGVMTNTSELLPRLARRTGARIIIGWGERLDGARGVRLHFKAAGSGVYDADRASATAALNAELETVIRSMPDQYTWAYRRFRIRPPGEADPYRSDEGLRQALERARVQ